MKILVFCMILSMLVLPVCALDIQAPAAPEDALDLMPEDTKSFSDGFLSLIRKAVSGLHPDLSEASRVSLGILAAVLIGSLLESVNASIGKTAVTAAVVSVASMLFLSADSLIRLATDTVTQIIDYGKLLLPVMTSALAAQGQITASAALSAGTALFSSLLQSIIAGFLIPGIYLFLAVSIGSHATGEDLLKRIADLIRAFVTWSMKILVTVFTTYLSLTGAISGTADAAALKATKVGMSTFVPVVGGVLSDASEAVLISAGLLKNAAGIYGIFAVLAIFLQPFLRIGIHYMILKLTGTVCTVFGSKAITGTVDTFCNAMGMLLGMTGCSCVLVLISTICFLKGTAA